MGLWSACSDFPAAMSQCLTHVVSFAFMISTSEPSSTL